MNFRWRTVGGALFCAVVVMLLSGDAANAQESSDFWSPKPKVTTVSPASYASTDPAPSMTDPGADSPGPRNDRPYAHHRFARGSGVQHLAQRQYYGPRNGGQPTLAQGARAGVAEGQLPQQAAEEIPAGAAYGAQYGTPFDAAPDGDWGDDGYNGYGPYGPPGPDCSCCTSGCGLCDWFGPWLWENFSVFGGAQGFKGPPDAGLNGNFGFHEGVNWGIPLWDECGLGYQLGFEAVHSDLLGGGNANESRTQTFLTTGIFHRPICGCGLQGGVVMDYLHDDWANMNLVQVRPEISMLFQCGHEVGFWAAVGTNRDTGVSPQIHSTVQWQANDMFAWFYRRRLCNNAIGRLWAGFTTNGEALIGFDASAPLTSSVTLQTAFNYAIPNSNDFPARAREESFALTMNLVWNLGYKCPCSPCNPYRPLFNVADNTTFFIDQSTVQQRQLETALSKP